MWFNNGLQKYPQAIPKRLYEPHSASQGHLSGTKKDADLKPDLAASLKEKLNRTLSVEKIKITHATDRVSKPHSGKTALENLRTLRTIHK